MFRKLMATMLAILVVAVTAEAKAPDVDVKSAALKKSLQARFPDVKIESVQPSKQLPGMYEVVTGTQIVYLEASGNYLLSGNLMDTRTQANLTAQRWDELHAIDFAALPLEHAITTVRGDGSRKLALFADPDCPYCQQLEHELKGIDNLTIYTFLFPLTKLHPDAYSKSVRIWCATDPQAAWSKWMLEKVPVEPATCKQDTIEQNLALGQKLGVAETPTMFLANGQRVGGALSRVELEAKLAAK